MIASGCLKPIDVSAVALREHDAFLKGLPCSGKVFPVLFLQRASVFTANHGYRSREVLAEEEAMNSRL